MPTPVIAAAVNATSPILFTEFRDSMQAAIPSAWSVRKALSLPSLSSLAASRLRLTAI
jgi:hypothetical protein